MTFTLRSFSLSLLLLPTVVAFVQRPRVSTSSRPLSALSVTRDDIVAAQEKIDAIIMEKNCGPILVRLAWHDSGTFDKNVDGEWPAAGGAIGSIRFEPEILHGANAGLSNAVKLLEPVKKACPEVSYADIYQMASARSIALAGGPLVDMKYGR